MPTIDLRSDTVTRPTPEMRQAMFDAELGDDVWGDDPTVIELERELAALLGKEAAVYVPSGTMGNLLSVRSQTQPGDEVIVHELAHMIVHEQAGIAVLCGAQTLTLSGARGLEPDRVRAVLRDPADIHHARQRVICIENTLGELGGLVFDPATQRELSAIAREHDLRVHLDGARLWNAAVASGVEPAELVRDVDSVSVCFSKGLGAPVGSAVVGDAGLVERARRGRKLLGGGMRQAGVIAAGALHALRHHRERMADDHRRARTLAEGLAGGRRLVVDPAAVETNIVLARPADGESAHALADELSAAGVLCAALDGGVVRFVTHLDVSDAEIDAALEICAPLLR